NAALGAITAGAAGTVTVAVNGGAVTDANGTGTNVSAGTLAASAGTGINLDTAVATITATTSGAGDITLRELDGVTLANVTAANGNILVSAGGLMTVTNVVAGGAGHNATLTTSAGDIAVGVAQAA